jgi:myo-inositol-1(or 4)-monophosphatase
MADMTHQAELEFVVDAVHRAGEIIRAVFRGEYGLWHKEGDDPVTTADLAADTLLREVISRAFPDDGWLSEETADSPERLGRRRVWIVDPLDGTREFVTGIPEFATSVGLVEDGRPCLGVVYNPVRDELFAAARGAGAWSGGIPLGVTGRSAFEGSVTLVSRSETSARLLEPLARRTALEPVGSVAYKLALVAAGRGDLTLSVRPKSEWDVCAGLLLVDVAGGLGTDLEGAAIGFNRPVPRLRGLLAAGPTLHAAARAFVAATPALTAALDAPKKS